MNPTSSSVLDRAVDPELGIRSRPAFELFDRLSMDEQASSLFNGPMHAQQIMNDFVCSAYDFAASRSVVDVGGGNGTLLEAILTRWGHARGVLFDRPKVIEKAQARIARSALAERIECVGGDFLKAVPSGGDVYILSTIIHDWDDHFAQIILRNCRAAMPVDATLLVCELVLPCGNRPYCGMPLDLDVLVSVGKSERTAAEHDQLLTSAGFRRREIVVNYTPFSAFQIIEAEAI